jgi:hypothetical protein
MLATGAGCSKFRDPTPRAVPGPRPAAVEGAAVMLGARKSLLGDNLSKGPRSALLQ